MTRIRFSWRLIEESIFEFTLKLPSALGRRALKDEPKLRSVFTVVDKSPPFRSNIRDFRLSINSPFILTCAPSSTKIVSLLAEPSQLQKKGAPFVSGNSRRSVLLCSLPALILSAACLLPYLNKAFTIDDPQFLLQAQQIRKEPLHPMAVSICWGQDTWCLPLARTMPGTVLMGYYLVPAVGLADPEWLAHLMQLIALCFGIAATVSLASRFGFGTFAACAAGLLVAATPPVLAMASTAMPDILAMSLGVIGIERLVAWKKDGKVFNGVVSALALGLAPIARVHLVFLWPVAAVLLRDDARIYDVRSWIALPKRRWIPLIAAAFVSAAAIALTHEPGSGLKPTQMYIVPEMAHHNLQSYLTYWIVAMPLGLAWFVLRNRRVRFWLLPIGLGLPLVWRVWIQHAPVVWTTLCAGLGAVVLMDIFLWSFQSRDQRRIACALWLLIPLVTLQYIHLPVKYLVPCAPAAALLIADLLPALRWRMAALCGIVAAGAIFGSMVLHADAQFAEMGRQAATRLIAPQVAAGHRVWFSSQWGLYWYAQKAGAQVLRSDDVPAPGDYLVRGKQEGYPGTLKRLPPAVEVETFTVGGPGGRSMSATDGAGLYTNFFPYGDLMWVWGTGEWNHYELWRFQ